MSVNVKCDIIEILLKNADHLKHLLLPSASESHKFFKICPHLGQFHCLIALNTNFDQNYALISSKNSKTQFKD